MEYIGKFKDLDIYVCIDKGIIIEKYNIKHISYKPDKLDKQINMFNEGYRYNQHINYGEDFFIVLKPYPTVSCLPYWYVSSITGDYNFILFGDFILGNSYIKELLPILDILE